MLIEFLRSLPRWVEFALVVIGAFGLFVISALAQAGAPGAVEYAASDFTFLSGFEIVVGTALLALLFVRGWRLADLGFLKPRSLDALDAVLLLFAVFFVSWLASFASPYFAASTPPSLPLLGQGINVGSALIFCLVNASFEEIFVCAYIIGASRKLGVWTAVAISAVIRMSYHVYQGPLDATLVGFFGLLLASYFATRGRLLPLIVVHFSLDVLAFTPYFRAE